MLINEQTIAELLQLGGQYFLPIAALLRALYSGLRGKFPEGLGEIGLASLFAGLTAIAGHEQPDFQSLLLEITGNTVLMAGLLAFIMTYLLRIPFSGLIVDGIVGGVIGLLAWLGWTYILGNPFPWWSLPLGIAAGAAGFVLLRMLLRQIGRLVKIATYFIIIGVVFVVIGGGLYLLLPLLQTPA